MTDADRNTRALVGNAGPWKCIDVAALPRSAHVMSQVSAFVSVSRVRVAEPVASEPVPAFAPSMLTLNGMMVALAAVDNASAVAIAKDSFTS